MPAIPKRKDMTPSIRQAAKALFLASALQGALWAADARPGASRSDLIKGNSSGADWSQYRGPNHDGISPEKIAWPSGGPKTLWKAPTPNGFSSFTVGGAKAFTIIGKEADGEMHEACIAFNAATGARLWLHEVDLAKYQGGGDSGANGNNGGDGPRSTPVYDDNHVYVYTSNLILYCLNAETGKEEWKIDMIKEHGGKNVAWSNASSPVIDGDLVFVNAGGRDESFLALDKKTGKVVWKIGSEKITHATPVVATILGRPPGHFLCAKRPDCPGDRNRQAALGVPFQVCRLRRNFPGGLR